MSAIDQRIVEMKFENHLFEKNAQTSISTLQKLKEALNFSGCTKSITDVEKTVNSIDFSKVESSLAAISDRFSTMGIVGMTVISNLTTSVMELGSRLMSNILAPIKTGGWNRATNIDKAKFQLQGLKVAWDDIKDDIDFGVTDTAYGLDAAATAASQLVASGVEFGKTFGEKGNSPMAKALRGISGVAAMTNSSYEEIGHIFTTVAGQGKLMTMQLRQLELRGLNVAAKLGEAMGKTEEEIRDMVSKGEIDFATFSSKMNEAFGEHATKANETFEGSMANMKAALSRIGADFATPMRKNIIPVFNSLKDVFKAMKTELGSLDEGTGVYGDFADLLEHLSNIATHFIKSFDLGWWKALTGWVHNVYQAFSQFMSSVTPLWDGLTKVEETVESTAEALENFDEIVQNIIRGDYGNGDERRSAIEEAFGLGWYEKLQNAVNEELGNDFRYDVPEGLEELGEKAEKEVSAVEKLDNAYTRLVESIKKVATGFKNMFNEGEKVQLFIHAKEIVDGVINGFEILVSVVTAFVNGAGEPLIRIVKDFIAFGTVGLGTIGKLISKLRNFMTESKAFTKIESVINNLFTKIANVIGKITGKGLNIFSKISSRTFGLADIFGDFWKVGTTAFDAIAKITGNITENFEGLKKKFTDFISAFKETSAYARLSRIFTKIGDTIIDLKDKAVNGLIDKLESLKELGIKLPEIDSEKWAESLSENINWLIDRIKSAKDAISEFFTKPRGGDGKSLIEMVGGWFTNVDFSSWKGFKKWISSIKEDIEGLFIDALGVKRFDKLKSEWEGIVSWFQTNVLSPLGLVGNSIIEQAGNTGSTIITWIQNNVIDPLGVAGDSLYSALEDILDTLAGFELPTVGGILGTILKGTLAYTVWNLFWAIQNIIKLIRGVGGTVFNFQKALGALKWFLYAKSISLATDSLFTIAKAIVAIALSMKLLGSMSWEQFGVAAAAIGVITLALGSLLWIANRYKGNQVLTPIDSIATTLAGLKSSINMFLTKVGKAVNIAAIALSVSILVRLIAKLNEIDWGDAKRSAKIMGLVMLELVAAYAGLSAVDKIFGNNHTLSSGVTLIAMAASVRLLGKVVKALGELSVSEAIQGCIAVGVICGLLIGMMKSANTLKGAALPLLAMIGVIAAICVGLGVLSLIDPDRLIKTGAALGIVIASIAAFVFAMKYGGKMDIRSVGSMIVMLGAIMVVIKVITVLLDAMRDLDGDNVIKIAGSIDSILVAIALLMMATNKLTKIGDGTPGSTFFNGVAIAGVISVWIITIGALLNLAGALNKGDSLVNQMKSGQKVMNEITSFMKKMIWLIFFIGVATKVMVNPLLGIGGNLELSLAAIGVLAEWVVGLGILSGVLGEINDFTNGAAAEFIAKGGVVLQALGNAIGLAVNGLIQGLLGIKVDPKVTEGGMLGIVQRLLDIVDMFAPYGTEKAVNTAGVESIVGFYLAFAKAELASGLAGLMSVFDFFGGKKNIKKMGEKLIKFAEYMSIYSVKIKGVNSDIVTQTSAAIETVMAYAQNVPNEGGLLGMLVGENDLGQFAEGLVPFATAMVKYSNIIANGVEGSGGFNVESVENSAAAIKTVLAFSHNVPNQGWLASWIFGDNTLKKFAVGLEPFATAMVKYSHIIAGEGGNGFNAEAVTNSENAIKAVIAFSNSIPNEGGKLAKWFGDNDLEKFASHLPSFAENLVTYANKLSGTDFSKIGEVNEVLTGLGTLAADLTYNVDSNLLSEKISSIGSQIEIAISHLSTAFSQYELIDINYIRELGPVLNEFGDVISEFWKHIKGTDKGIKAVVQAGVDVIDLLTGDSGFSSTWLDSIANKKSSFDNFAEIMKNLRSKVKKQDSLYTQVGDAITVIGLLSKNKTFDTTWIDDIVADSQNLIDFATTANTLANTIKDFNAKSVDKAAKMIEMVQKFDTTKLNVNGLIDTFFGVGDATQSYSADAVTVATRMVEYANLVIEYANLMATVDVDNLSEQFDKISEWFNGENVQKMFNTEDEHSFTAIALNLADAFARGFGSEEFTSTVESAGSNLATSIISGWTDSEGDVTSAIESLIGTVSSTLTEATIEGSETITAASDYATTLAGTIQSTLDENGEEISSSAESIMNLIINAINSNKDSAVGAVDAAGKEMKNAGESYVPLFRTLGKDIIRGLASGIRLNKGEAINAAASTLTEVYGAAKEAVKSSSPSKKFIELGKNNVLGLAIGMNDNKKLAIRPAHEIGEAMVSSMSESLEDRQSIVDEIMGTVARAYLFINELINNGIQQPVISPVLDLTNVRNGVGDIGTILSGTSLNTGLAFSSPSPYQNTYEMSNYNQAEIISSIRGLRTDINTLGDAMSRMQITMSTGQVVGAVTPGIDRSLGSIQKYNARWA